MLSTYVIVWLRLMALRQALALLAGHYHYATQHCHWHYAIGLLRH